MLCMGAEKDIRQIFPKTSRRADMREYITFACGEVPEFASGLAMPARCELASFAKRNALCEYYFSSLALLVIDPLTIWILYSNDTSSSRSLKLTT